MPDELEQQLRAFGTTLQAQTDGGITSATDSDSARPGVVGLGRSHRTWAMIGAAACVAAGLGGLAFAGRYDRHPNPPAAAPPDTALPVPTTIPDAVIDTSDRPVDLTTTVAQTTTTTSIASDLGEIVPPDPLALERDGWTLLQRDVDAFQFSTADLPCPAAEALAGFTGIGEVHDVLTLPDLQGLDLDIQVLDVGVPERGAELAAAVSAIGPCLAESQAVEVTTFGNASMRASWFQAGPEFALATIVGEGNLSIVLEIEGAPFGDDLINDLVSRSSEFLRGVRPVTEPTTGVTPPTTALPVEAPTVEATPEQAAALAGNAAGLLLCDGFGVGAQQWDWPAEWSAGEFGRAAVDAFHDVISEQATDAASSGARAYPTEGWTELVVSPQRSVFVLEVDGSLQAAITVNGDPAAGVWRQEIAEFCVSLVAP